MQKIETFGDIGRNVRALRRSQQLTQVQLAAVAGVGVRFIRELEQGKDTCQVGKVFSVCRALGLDLFIVGSSLDEMEFTP